MSQSSTLETFEELVAQRLDRKSIYFSFSGERPDGISYRISSEQNGKDDLNDALSPGGIEIWGKIVSSDQFNGCPCEFNINDPYKSKYTSDGCLGWGMYEKASNRFHFWLRLSREEFIALINKWTLETLVCSNVTETFGEDYWITISLKCINFSRGESLYSDGDAINFDIVEGNF